MIRPANLVVFDEIVDWCNVKPHQWLCSESARAAVYERMNDKHDSLERLDDITVDIIGVLIDRMEATA